MAVAAITAADIADIMAPVSDSVSAFTRLTDMLLRSAIPPDSMTQTACGNTIRVALCRTDIKLDGQAALPTCCGHLASLSARSEWNRAIESDTRGGG